MDNRLKQFVKKALSSLGIHVTKNQRYDALSLQVMEKTISSDSNCIDVGAHKGEILDEIIKLAPNGKHCAFEPIPEMFDALKEKYHHHSNISIHNFALADSCGTSTFQHVRSNPAYSGLKKRSYRQSEDIDEIKVERTTLDTILPSGSPHIDFIKIDVEGGELQVLKGARGVLNRCHPVVIFEHGLGASDHYGTTPEMVYDFLADDCNMSVALLDKFVIGGPALSRDEFKEQFYKSKNYYFVAYRHNQ